MAQRKARMVSPRYGAVVGITVLLVSLCVLLVDLRAGRSRSGKGESCQYEAEWVFAAAQEEIITNVLGDVVQPTNVEYNWKHGALPRSSSAYYPYYNLQMYVEDRVASFLSKEVQKQKLLEKYLSQDDEFDPVQVSNAFASVRYQIFGKYIPVIKVLVRSGDPDVAVGVLSFIAREFSEDWQKDEDDKVSKAVILKWIKVERLKKKGEPFEDELKEYEESKRRAELYSTKMLTLVPPRVRKL